MADFWCFYIITRPFLQKGDHLKRICHITLKWQQKIIGIIALIAVDVYQLKIPDVYGSIIDGLDPKTEFTLTKPILIDLCLDMLLIVAVLVVGRFLWRICFFGSAIKVETDIRNEMFNHCKDLSQSN